MADMTQPSQSALTSMIHDISVDYFILPGYVQDTAGASQVECVDLLSCPEYVVHVSLPCSNVLVNALTTSVIYFVMNTFIFPVETVNSLRLFSAQ